MNSKIEKLSYEELIKALDCCAHTIETNRCGECPAAKYKAGTCDALVKLQAAEMLKELKAENERFKKIETTVNGFWGELQKLAMFKDKEIPTLEELLEYIENCKSEAIKEFAERLKSFLNLYQLGEKEIVCLEDIDNLVKEMTGIEQLANSDSHEISDINDSSCDTNNRLLATFIGGDGI